MFADKGYLIYNRGLGFLTESGTWDQDIVNAELFTEAEAEKTRDDYKYSWEDKYNPVIFKWC